MTIRILLLFCAIIGAQSSPAPNLTPCKQDDLRCMAKNANVIYKLSVQGVPELNIQKLEPIHHDEIEGNFNVLKYKLRNTTISGFKNCDVVNAKLNLNDLKLLIGIVCPLCDMYGLYEVSGQILSIPIEGKGDFKIQVKDYHIQVDSDIKLTPGKGGKKYFSFKNFKVNGELKGGMLSNLTNLFNGKHNELAANVLRFLNDNWEPVAKELQGPVFNANVKKLIKNFNKYLKIVPMDQLVQDIV